MNAVFGATILIIALCFQTRAYASDFFTPITDEFTAVCWYTMLGELCGFPITAKQRAALASVAKKARDDSADGEEVTANIRCASLFEGFKAKAWSVCTPQGKEAYIEALDKIVSEEEAARK